MSFARFTFGRLSHIPANVKLWESPRLSRGFTAIKHHAPGVQVKFVGAMKPSRTRSDIPAVQRVIEAVELGYGIAPIVQPCLGGSLPDYVWTRTLGVPSVLVPYANADENNHAPNENLDVDKFYAGIKCTISVLDVLGKTRRVVSIP